MDGGFVYGGIGSGVHIHQRSVSARSVLSKTRKIHVSFSHARLQTLLCCLPRRSKNKTFRKLFASTAAVLLFLVPGFPSLDAFKLEFPISAGPALAANAAELDHEIHLLGQTHPHRSGTKRKTPVRIVCAFSNASSGKQTISASKESGVPKLSTPELSGQDQITVAVRLLFSIFCGMIIGVERRAARATAGVRTLCLVSLGSAIFTLSSMLSNCGDPPRMAAQIATGVGFIGAGCMQRASEHNAHRGLTTAASIWIAAALGVTNAGGLHILGLSASLLTVLILRYANVQRYTELRTGNRIPLGTSPPSSTSSLIFTKRDSAAISTITLEKAIANEPATPSSELSVADDEAGQNQSEKSTVSNLSTEGTKHLQESSFDNRKNE